MKLLSPTRRRIIAGFLSAIYFLVNGPLSHALEANVWKERKRVQMAALPSAISLPPAPATLSPRLKANTPSFQKHSKIELLKSLPYSFGTVRGVQLPSGVAEPKIVIHIQDIHANEEAQTNISRTIRELSDNNTAALVALEGAFGELDLSKLNDYPNQDIVKAIAGYSLKHNEISGAIHGALMSPSSKISIVGIDDKTHYDANVVAYKATRALAKTLKTELAGAMDGVESRKAGTFGPTLGQFDRAVQAYHDGRMDFGPYVKLLKSATPSYSFEIEKFLEALDLESRMDFARVEKERTALLAEMGKRLKETDLDNLSSAAAAFRLGELGSSDFYSYFKSLAQTNRIDLSRYPAMSAYFQYVLLSEQINSEALFAEIAVLEKQAYGSLAQTEAEKRLVAESKYLALAAKLVDFSLTKDEWGHWRDEQQRQANDGRAPWNEHGQGSLKENLSLFERFYEEAEIRDQKMAENVLAAMKNRGAKVAVVVAGGFHASGLRYHMQNAGVGIVSFVPKISKVDSENSPSYLTAFAQEKTPLQKLFEGEKLFLAQHPMPPHLASLAFPARVAMMQESFEKGDRPASQDQLTFEQAGGDPRFRLSSQDERGGVKAEVSGPESTVRMSLRGEGSDLRFEATPEMPSLTATLFRGPHSFWKNLPARIVFFVAIPIQEAGHIMAAKWFHFPVKWTLASFWSKVLWNYDMARPKTERRRRFDAPTMKLYYQSVRATRLAGPMANLFAGVLGTFAFGLLDFSSFSFWKALAAWFVLSNYGLVFFDAVLARYFQRGDFWDAFRTDTAWEPFHRVVNAVSTMSPDVDWDGDLAFLKTPQNFSEPLVAIIRKASVDLQNRWWRFQTTPRQGGIDRKIPRPIVWSVADHTALLMIMVDRFAKDAGLTLDETNEAYRYALIHDIGELLTGDITPRNPERWKGKHPIEQKAWKVLGRELPIEHQRWQTYEEQNQPAARFVKQLDKVAGLIELMVYAHRDPSHWRQTLERELEPNERPTFHQWADMQGHLKAHPGRRHEPGAPAEFLFLATLVRQLEQKAESMAIAFRAREEKNGSAVRPFESDVVRRRFAESLRTALDGQTNSISTLKTFATQPTGHEKGRYVSINWSGTNATLTLVELLGNGRYTKGSVQDGTEIKFKFSDAHKADPMSAFEAIADQIVTIVGPDTTTPVGIGFIFSFPMDQTSLRDGRLVAWAKGWADPSDERRKIIGRDVGGMLNELLRKRGYGNVTVNALANDTLNPMIVYSYISKGKNSRAVAADFGSILGTGHNTASIDFNFETGGFSDVESVQSHIDRLLDANVSEPAPGRMLYEKLVSGLYLPEILRLTLVDLRDKTSDFQWINRTELARPFALKGEDLPTLAYGHDALAMDVRTFFKARFSVDISIEEAQLVRFHSRKILDRSAALVAGQYAGLMDVFDPDRRNEHVIAIEGSLYVKNPDYQNKVQAELGRLLGPDATRVRLEPIDGAEGVGAAILAAKNNPSGRDERSPMSPSAGMSLFLLLPFLMSMQGDGGAYLLLLWAVVLGVILLRHQPDRAFSSNTIPNVLAVYLFLLKQNKPVSEEKIQKSLNHSQEDAGEALLILEYFRYPGSQAVVHQNQIDGLWSVDEGNRTMSREVLRFISDNMPVVAATVRIFSELARADKPQSDEMLSRSLQLDINMVKKALGILTYFRRTGDAPAALVQAGPKGTSLTAEAKAAHREVTENLKTHLLSSLIYTENLDRYVDTLLKVVELYQPTSKNIAGWIVSSAVNFHRLENPYENPLWLVPARKVRLQMVREDRRVREAVSRLRKQGNTDGLRDVLEQLAVTLGTGGLRGYEANIKLNEYKALLQGAIDGFGSADPRTGTGAQMPPLALGAALSLSTHNLNALMWAVYASSIIFIFSMIGMTGRKKKGPANKKIPIQTQLFLRLLGLLQNRSPEDVARGLGLPTPYLFLEKAKAEGVIEDASDVEGNVTKAADKLNTWLKGHSPELQALKEIVPDEITPIVDEQGRKGWVNKPDLERLAANGRVLFRNQKWIIVPASSNNASDGPGASPVEHSHLPLYLWRGLKQRLTIAKESGDFPDDVFNRVVTRSGGLARRVNGEIQIETAALPYLVEELNASRSPQAIPATIESVRAYLEEHENLHADLDTEDGRTILTELQANLDDLNILHLKESFANNYGTKDLDRAQFIEELLVTHAIERDLLDQPVRLVGDRKSPRVRTDLPENVRIFVEGARLALALRLYAKERVYSKNHQGLLIDAAAALGTYGLDLKNEDVVRRLKALHENDVVPPFPQAPTPIVDLNNPRLMRAYKAIDLQLGRMGEFFTRLEFGKKHIRQAQSVIDDILHVALKRNNELRTWATLLRARQLVFGAHFIDHIALVFDEVLLKELKKVGYKFDQDEHWKSGAVVLRHYEGKLPPLLIKTSIEGQIDRVREPLPDIDVRRQRDADPWSDVSGLPKDFFTRPEISETIEIGVRVGSIERALNLAGASGEDQDAIRRLPKLRFGDPRIRLYRPIRHGLTGVRVAYVERDGETYNGFREVGGAQPISMRVRLFLAHLMMTMQGVWVPLIGHYLFTYGLVLLAGRDNARGLWIRYLDKKKDQSFEIGSSSLQGIDDILGEGAGRAFVDRRTVRVHSRDFDRIRRALRVLGFEEMKPKKTDDVDKHMFWVPSFGHLTVFVEVSPSTPASFQKTAIGLALPLMNDSSTIPVLLLGVIAFSILSGAGYITGSPGRGHASRVTTELDGRGMLFWNGGRPAVNGTIPKQPLPWARLGRENKNKKVFVYVKDGVVTRVAAADGSFDESLMIIVDKKTGRPITSCNQKRMPDFDQLNERHVIKGARLSQYAALNIGNWEGIITLPIQYANAKVDITEILNPSGQRAFVGSVRTPMGETQMGLLHDMAKGSKADSFKKEKLFNTLTDRITAPRFKGEDGRLRKNFIISRFVVEGRFLKFQGKEVMSMAYFPKPEVELAFVSGAPRYVRLIQDANGNPIHDKTTMQPLVIDLKGDIHRQIVDRWAGFDKYMSTSLSAQKRNKDDRAFEKLTDDLKEARVFFNESQYVEAYHKAIGVKRKAVHHLAKPQGIRERWVDLFEEAKALLALCRQRLGRPTPFTPKPIGASPVVAKPAPKKIKQAAPRASLSPKEIDELSRRAWRRINVARALREEPASQERLIDSRQALNELEKFSDLEWAALSRDLQLDLAFHRRLLRKDIAQLAAVSIPANLPKAQLSPLALGTSLALIDGDVTFVWLGFLFALLLTVPWLKMFPSGSSGDTGSAAEPETLKDLYATGQALRPTFQVSLLLENEIMRFPVKLNVSAILKMWAQSKGFDEKRLVAALVAVEKAKRDFQFHADGVGEATMRALPFPPIRINNERSFEVQIDDPFFQNWLRRNEPVDDIVYEVALRMGEVAFDGDYFATRAGHKGIRQTALLEKFIGQEVLSYGVREMLGHIAALQICGRDVFRRNFRRELANYVAFYKERFNKKEAIDMLLVFNRLTLYLVIYEGLMDEQPSDEDREMGEAVLGFTRVLREKMKLSADIKTDLWRFYSDVFAAYVLKPDVVRSGSALHLDEYFSKRNIVQGWKWAITVLKILDKLDAFKSPDELAEETRYPLDRVYFALEVLRGIKDVNGKAALEWRTGRNVVGLRKALVGEAYLPDILDSHLKRMLRIVEAFSYLVTTPQSVRLDDLIRILGLSSDDILRLFYLHSPDAPEFHLVRRQGPFIAVTPEARRGWEKIIELMRQGLIEHLRSGQEQTELNTAISIVLKKNELRVENVVDWIQAIARDKDVMDRNTIEQPQVKREMDAQIARVDRQIRAVVEELKSKGDRAFLEGVLSLVQRKKAAPAHRKIYEDVIIAALKELSATSSQFVPEKKALHTARPSADMMLAVFSALCEADQPLDLASLSSKSGLSEEETALAIRTLNYFYDGEHPGFKLVREVNGTYSAAAEARIAKPHVIARMREQLAVVLDDASQLEAFGQNLVREVFDVQPTVSNMLQWATDAVTGLVDYEGEEDEKITLPIFESDLRVRDTVFLWTQERKRGDLEALLAGINAAINELDKQSPYREKWVEYQKLIEFSLKDLRNPPASLFYLLQNLFGVAHSVSADRALKTLGVEAVLVWGTILWLGPTNVSHMIGLAGGFVFLHMGLLLTAHFLKRGPPLTLRSFVFGTFVPALVITSYIFASQAPGLLSIIACSFVFAGHYLFDRILLSVPARNRRASPLRILLADQPQRESIPEEMKQMIASMGLDGQVDIIDERGTSGDQTKLKSLIEKYKPAIIIISTGRNAMVDPYVVKAAKDNGVRAVIRAGAGYDNINMEATIRYGVPFLRSHGLRSTMGDMTLRFLLASARIQQGNEVPHSETDVSSLDSWKDVFKVTPNEFLGALDQAKSRKRGDITEQQKRLLFASMSEDELKALVRSWDGKIIGLLGFGEIGQEVAGRLIEIKKKIGATFDLWVTSPSLLESQSKARRIANRFGSDLKIVSEQTIREHADIISIHIPSADANRNYLTAEKFRSRSKPLVLLNTARRDIVNDDLFTSDFAVIYIGDLDYDSNIVALRDGKPKNVLLTPHMGGLTESAASGAKQNVLKALREVLEIIVGRKKSDALSFPVLNRLSIQSMPKGQSNEGKIKFVDLDGAKPKTETSENDRSSKIASEIYGSILNYFDDFDEITSRAEGRFLKAEWKEDVQDGLDRINLQSKALKALKETLKQKYGISSFTAEEWDLIKSRFDGLLGNIPHAPLAARKDLMGIYLQSVARLYFPNEALSGEDVYAEVEPFSKTEAPKFVDRLYRFPFTRIDHLVKRVVGKVSFVGRLDNVSKNSDIASNYLRYVLGRLGYTEFDVRGVEIINNIFYQNKVAYQIGRLILDSGQFVPVAFGYRNDKGTIYLDVILAGDEEVNPIFSYSRANFHVDIASHRGLVEYLHQVLPEKNRIDLLAAIGFHSPAKEEFKKVLKRKLKRKESRFVYARGAKGNAMDVITFRGFPYVLKIPREVSPKPHFIGRNEIIEKYRQVHRVDRVGRMLDGMRLQNMVFDPDNFDPALLADLQNHSPTSVRFVDGKVIVSDIFVQKKVVPLNIFLENSSARQREKAMKGLGDCIKDLLAIGIFPGDLLLKNFGVDSDGKVLYYDYDDIDDIARYSFKVLPKPRDSLEETLDISEWFFAQDTDVFPEQFGPYLIPAEDLDAFKRFHSDLLIPHGWVKGKNGYLSGDVADSYPYSSEKRLVNFEKAASVPQKQKQISLLEKASVINVISHLFGVPLISWFVRGLFKTNSKRLLSLVQGRGLVVKFEEGLSNRKTFELHRALGLLNTATEGIRKTDLHSVKVVLGTGALPSSVGTHSLANMSPFIFLRRFVEKREGEYFESEKPEIVIDIRKARPANEWVRIFRDLLTTSANLNPQNLDRIYLEPFKPASESVVWSLNSEYWAHYSQPEGVSKSDATEHAKSFLRRVAGNHGPLSCLEIGAVSTERALIFLNAIKHMAGDDVLKRLTYVVGTRNHRMVTEIQDKLQKSFPSVQIKTFLWMAAAPLAREPGFPSEFHDIYVGNVLNSIPAEALVVRAGRFYRRESRAYIVRSHVRSLAHRFQADEEQLVRDLEGMSRSPQEFWSKYKELIGDEASFLSFRRAVWNFDGAKEAKQGVNRVKFDDRYVALTDQELESLLALKLSIDGTSDEGDNAALSVVREIEKTDRRHHVPVNLRAMEAFHDLISVLSKTYGVFTFEGYAIQGARRVYGPVKQGGNLYEFLYSPLFEAISEKMGLKFRFSSENGRPAKIVVSAPGQTGDKTKQSAGRLILLRHGEAEHNERDSYAGTSDTKLTAKGESQVRATANRYRGVKFDAVYTSGLVRAQRSARVFLDEIESAASVEVVPALNEKNQGILEGKTRSDLFATYGEATVRRWLRSFHVAPPQGQSLADISAVTTPFYRDVILPRLARGETVLIAAHGGPIRALEKEIEKLSGQALEKLEIPNAATLEYRMNATSKLSRVEHKSVPLLVKAIASSLALCAMAYLIYGVSGVYEGSHGAVYLAVANIATFWLFTVLLDALSQWMAGHGWSEKQFSTVAWKAAPLMAVATYLMVRAMNSIVPAKMAMAGNVDILVNAALIWAALLVVNGVIRLSLSDAQKRTAAAHLASVWKTTWTVSLVVGVLLAAINLTPYGQSAWDWTVYFFRLFWPMLIVHFRSRGIYTPFVGKIRGQDAKRKQIMDEVFWLTRTPSVGRISFVYWMERVFGIPFVSLDGFTTQFFSLFYYYRVNLGRFFFNNERLRKSKTFLIAVPIILPILLLWKLAKNVRDRIYSEEAFKGRLFAALAESIAVVQKSDGSSKTELIDNLLAGVPLSKNIQSIDGRFGDVLEAAQKADFENPRNLRSLQSEVQKRFKMGLRQHDALLHLEKFSLTTNVTLSVEEALETEIVPKSLVLVLMTDEMVKNASEFVSRLRASRGRGQKIVLVAGNNDQRQVLAAHAGGDENVDVVVPNSAYHDLPDGGGKQVNLFLLESHLIEKYGDDALHQISKVRVFAPMGLALKLPADFQKSIWNRSEFLFLNAALRVMPLSVKNVDTLMRLAKCLAVQA